MRKLESIYKAMKWDSVDYINTTVLTSKNNKDSRAFCLLPEEDAICAEQRPLVRLPAATRRSTTATFIKGFR